MFYLDTSVLIPYYLPESKSRTVQKFLSSADVKIISSLVHVELFSAVSRRVRMGEYTLEVARQIAELFRSHVASGVFKHVPITQQEYVLAEGWITRFDTPLRTLDALHLAAAYQNGLTLLTSDKTLADCAKKYGISSRIF